MNEIDILEKLVSFNTIKDKENKQIMDYIEIYTNNLGFRTIFRNKILVVANCNNLKDAGIAFVGHTDTVDASNWNYDPFILTREGNKLIGLGTCDMKGGISCILEAIREIDFNSLNKKMLLVFTYDEEIGFSGIKDFLNLNLKMPKRIIIGEPTYNKAYLGSKGLQEYKVTFNGIVAHSSTPFKGKNAILLALKFINELNTFYENIIKKDTDNDFDVPYSTFNIGTIDGGKAINIVADKCVIKFDFRTIPSNEEKINKYICKLAKKYEADLEIINNIKAFKNMSKLYKKCNISPFITEASFLEEERIILGPGPINPHEKNEYVEIDSLRKCVADYKKIIMQSCK